MNCRDIATAMNWECSPVGSRTLQLHAPVSLGLDGQLASFYVMEDRPGHFFLTDAQSTVSHAIDHGAKITPSRLKKISEIPGARHASLAEDGEITASGENTRFRFALWDALRLALAISDNEIAWLPRSRHERFAAQVAKNLRAELPRGSVVSKPRLVGVSGHQIEFPIGVVTQEAGHIIIVQPIGVSEDHRVDWGYVYQSYGKLADLKKATPKEVQNRVVVMEPGAPKEEFGRAATVLSETARVLTFVDHSQFAKTLLAA